MEEKTQAAKSPEINKKGKEAKAEKGKKGKSAPKKAKSKRRSVVAGKVYVHAGFNNTIITITDNGGETIAWASAGGCGFKGARKSTPYAAQVAAETATGKAKIFGLEKVDVYVRGIGPGREQAIRGLHVAGLTLESITDLTPVPHNGCRQKKSRRV